MASPTSAEKKLLILSKWCNTAQVMLPGARENNRSMSTKQNKTKHMYHTGRLHGPPSFIFVFQQIYPVRDVVNSLMSHAAATTRFTEENSTSGAQKTMLQKLEIKSSVYAGFHAAEAVCIERASCRIGPGGRV